MILKKLGAVPHSNSGAGNVKHDGHDDNNLYEIKDANISYTLKGEELETLFKRAVRQGRNGVFIIYFKSRDLTAEITITKGKGTR